MIHYIVGRNLGHLNPCVANVSKFQDISEERLKIYAFKHTHPWLRANLPKVKLRTFNPGKVRQKSESMLKSDLVIHDWREEVQKLKQTREKNTPIIGGIYHSDLSVTKADTPWTLKFKNQIKEISQKSTDIFFHINLTQPEKIPKLSTKYIPIPLIAREITLEPKQIKKILGIPHKEPFILVQMGGGVGKYRYKFMQEWFEKINGCKTPYHIVVANQLGGLGYKFRKGIIQPPLFDNGRDLVNAASMVISKPGMGILMDCISTGTPLLALPADTKEREVKNMMLQDLVGSDICLSSNKFTAENLSKRVEEISKHRKQFERAFRKVPQNGADVIAQSMHVLSGHSLDDLPELHKKILKLTPFSGK